jgi:hypothetical protein
VSIVSDIERLYSLLARLKASCASTASELAEQYARARDAQASTEKTLEHGSRVTMRIDELLLLPRLHFETHHVECGHVTPSVRYPNP